MDIQGTLEQLKQELKRIDTAIAALGELDQTAPRRGRPPGATQATGRKRRTMSAAARARIAAAQRARWARQKGTAPKKVEAAAKKSAGRRSMSAAARKKLSAMMKAKWAARKKAA